LFALIAFDVVKAKSHQNSIEPFLDQLAVDQQSGEKETVRKNNQSAGQEHQKKPWVYIEEPANHKTRLFVADRFPKCGGIKVPAEGFTARK